jgi:phosphopentomutase
VLAWSRSTEAKGGNDLGTLDSFADIGQTVLEALGCTERQAIGTSFLSRMQKEQQS